MSVCSQSRAAASMQIPGGHESTTLGLTRGRANPAMLLSIWRRLSRQTRSRCRRAQVSLPRPRPTWAGVEPGKWEKPRGTKFWDLQWPGGPLNNAWDAPDKPSNWALGDFKCFVNRQDLALSNRLRA